MDVKSKDGDGQTALHCAALKGRLDIIKLLIETGQADVGVINKKGQSAADIAADVVADVAADIEASGARKKRTREIYKYLTCTILQS
jgi:ankyrin repeat protein